MVTVFLQPLFEVCDDGFTDACGTCNADCTGAGTGSSCGDGEVCPEVETCDDGFTDSCGSCNADCSGPGVAPVCGDGEHCVESEFCDDGYTDACGSCNEDCTAPGTGSTCGDGVTCPEAGEVCDDFNTNSCDGCNADCTRVDNVCGDAIVECTEQCDDGAGNALHPNFGGCESDVGYDRICVFGPPAHCAGDIDVPDPNLAEVLRSALGLADNEPIQFSPSLRELWAPYRNISDLTGLGCFVHLRNLYLNGNSISELTDFEYLSSLRPWSFITIKSPMSRRSQGLRGLRRSNFPIIRFRRCCPWQT